MECHKAQVLIVLLAAGVARIYGQLCGDTRIVNQDQDIEGIFYSIFDQSYPPSTCEFTTSLSAEDRDVFMVTIYTNRRYNNDDEIILPAGGILPRSSQRWCGLYRKQEGDEINCGVNLNSLCQNVLAVSNDWPPVVRSESYSYTAFVEFQVIRCSDTMEETTVKTTLTTAAQNEKIEPLTTATSNVPTTKSGNNLAETGVTKKSVSTDENTTPLIAVIIVLSVLLVISLLVMAIFMKKYLISKNSSTTKHNNDNNTRPATVSDKQYESIRIDNNYESVSDPYELPISNGGKENGERNNYDQFSACNRNRETPINNQFAINQDTYEIANDPNQANDLIDNVLYQPIYQ
ncbi:unnamed protein product [Clavelina lepadiformis]|uniref:Uncharacterized protein n=1 Tax=Clavelina lepadiformis TaxID=159417 RepID=A0ABP0FLM4_CLALP